MVCFPFLTEPLNSLPSMLVENKIPLIQEISKSRRSRFREIMRSDYAVYKSFPSNCILLSITFPLVNFMQMLFLRIYTIILLIIIIIFIIYLYSYKC